MHTPTILLHPDQCRALLVSLRAIRSGDVLSALEHPPEGCGRLGDLLGDDDGDLLPAAAELWMYGLTLIGGGAAGLFCLTLAANPNLLPPGHTPTTIAMHATC